MFSLVFLIWIQIAPLLFVLYTSNIIYIVLVETQL